MTGTVADFGLDGATATIRDAETTLKLVAGAPPKVTALAPSRSEPVIATEVPPASGPLVALSPVIVGAGWISTS